MQIPGGGFGIFNGCTQEFGTPSTGWGAQYGGVASRSQCGAFPAALKDGCYWRFDWFQGADNPGVTFKQVSCPAEITAKTGCVRADDSSMGKSSGSGSNSGGGKQTTTTSAAPAATTTTSSANGAAQAKYGQCGGIGWAGPTACVAGTTCRYGNDWYSQCL
jgi:Glycosyl hydrolase family 45/Fungal cellulose binding domain